MPARTPEQCDQLFGEYLNARDLDGVVALYEPQATLVNQDGSLSCGTDAIRNAFKEIFAAVSEGKINMNVVRVIGASDDLAVLYNDWNMTGKTVDGFPFAFDHKATEVVRRQPDGTWRFAVDDPYARG